MDYDKEIEIAADYVRALFRQSADDRLLYHNLAHTERVAYLVNVIGSHCGVAAEDRLILSVAAWFHDVGHLTGLPRGHEKRSVQHFRAFARRQAYERGRIEAIEECIAATRMPHHPKNLLGEIICDADTYNLGTEEFVTTDTLLEKETGLRMGEEPANWNEGALILLQSHRFFTDYCRSALDAGKEANINRVKVKLAAKAQ